MPKKIIIFGAGKIGRSFIGQLFSRGGYEVVFVDTCKTVIDELNHRKAYTIIIKAETDEIITVTNVRGIYAGDEAIVTEEICDAEIMAVSVGMNGLSSAISLIGKGLFKRFTRNMAACIDIIIAENMRNAADFFKSELEKHLPHEYPVDSLVGLVETSIGKMVPIMPKNELKDNLLHIYAEPYNTLILDKKAFKNPIPEVKGLAPKENMKAWFDRKLFIHNLGHAAAAYIGFAYNPDFIYLHEALAVPEVHDKVKSAMMQSADILLNEYPDEFSPEDLQDHINDLLLRFQNKALGDTIFRVGCDLMRKLGPEDRLAGAIRLAIAADLPYDKILYALVCACHFRAKDEDGKMLKEDIEFIAQCKKGIKWVLTSICGFDENTNSELFHVAEMAENKYGY